jgi:cytochrome c-type biogenesis protein CcmH
MNEFLVIAALMAAVAACAVAWPLLRHRENRLQGAIVAILIVGSGAGLYSLWSNWNWRLPPPQAQPDISAMVVKLEERLRSEPSDIAGWLMLGRSYGALEKFDQALAAYQHAHSLDAKNVEATMGLGEAISMRAGGQLTPESAQLFEEAVGLAPDNPRALLYGGFSAAMRGDKQLAKTRWQTLKTLHPPPQLEQMLDARIAELGAETPSAATTDGTNAPVAGTDSPTARVNLRIAPALQAKISAAVRLFVFAREPEGRGPPLAAKRLTTEAIGTLIELSASDSMIPGRVLKRGQTVLVTARVSFSGQPTPATGDLYGELSYAVGSDGVRDLVIDKIAN